MNFFKALLYPFEQEDWVIELVIAVAVAAIPVLGFFMIKGWEFEISYRVRHNLPRLLPGWGDLWGKLTRGFLIRVTALVYHIPTVILFIATIALWLDPLVRALKNAGAAAKPLGDAYLEGLGLRLGLIPVTLIVWMLMNSLYWSGYLRYIETGRFVMFFDLATNFESTITTFLDDLIMLVYVAILDILLGLLDAGLGGLLAATGIGAILAVFLLPGITFMVMSAFSGYLFGEMAKDAFKYLRPPEPQPAPRPRGAGFDALRFVPRRRHVLPRGTDRESRPRRIRRRRP